MRGDTAPDVTTDRARPRVVGPREDEILDATLTLLGEVGYDRLTMDAVASAARAGKATLYRRWSSKGALVVDALERSARCHRAELPNTGSLRGDLFAGACGRGGLTDDQPVTLMASLFTAMQHDRDLREAFGQRIVEPQREAIRTLLAKGQERGEVSEHADLGLLLDILPAMAVLRVFLHGRPPDADLMSRIIDGVVLPAALHAPTPVARSTGSP